MQLNLHDTRGYNAIRRYDADGFLVNETHHETAILILPEGTVREWSIERPDALEESEADPLLELEPELVIVGTGRIQVFPPAGFMKAFLGRGIGCEIMDTGAACRTYNVLAEEGRWVLGALMVAA